MSDSTAHTFGIDLAAQPSKTAACLVAWTRDGAHLVRLAVGADDDLLTELRTGAAMTAIDAPFGWPVPFVDAVNAWRDQVSWPNTAATDLRHRLTDKDVATRLGLQPLSVSSDRIATCAWRCATLLTRWHITDRTGRQGAAEVYPAAALRCWSLPYSGSKHEASVRQERIGAIRTACPWLEGSQAEWTALAVNDHALDALICALVGRAIVVGSVGEIPPARRSTAEREGWIHLPTGDMTALVSGSPRPL
jgi:hypothetical protein